MLGFTQLSWDNLSGKETQPWSWSKYWIEMSVNEQAAIVLLGYTQRTWDNDSGLEPQPDSYLKSWSELTKCGDGEISVLHIVYLPVCLLAVAHI